MKKKLPESYLKRMEQLKQSGGLIRQDINKDELQRLKDELRLSPQYERLNPENVQEVIKEQKSLEKSFLEDEAKRAKELSMKPKMKSSPLPKDKLYNKLGKLLSISEAVGSRGLKSVPVLGLGLGLASAAKAAQEGDYKKAGLEALSAIDPTPLTDLYLASQEIGDLIREKKDPQKELQEIVKPMIKEVGGEPDMKPKKALKLSGEKEDEDIEDMTNIINYEDYLNKRKKQFGY